ncbi:dTDP-4-amino-4,6-dideoxygalactose transaminase [Cryobacterium sp. N21]|uniref:dTDP-4-amino-4,6-dideoxygalactose transaminase n=1 Tax=Cryobacterium sp. N21 TaxID=2048289 RepID=UPI000CE3E272|nr:dTDP-4-amino-4,6-dideoxygalactose transaminase [Cryobacterium sp. N21]
MSLPVIPFSRPFRSANESRNLDAVLASGHVHGDGPFTESATERLQGISGAQNVLLTSSCTHALEMTSLLLGLTVGDEVILPSFTFPSAATAIALTGAVPVFVDIDAASGNIDPSLIEAAITSRTKALSIVHYGGVAVDMDEIIRISDEHGLPFVEDNAHALGAMWKGLHLGTLGSLGTQSFHDTKNVHSGEGGALLINDEALLERAEIIREKGTDRSRFLRGQVDKYTWNDIGSSYLMSELNAAVLDSQLSEFDTIQGLRHAVWNRYSSELLEWSEDVGVRRMFVDSDRKHTAHVFYLVMPDHDQQTALLAHLRKHGIVGTFHYIPLDSSPAGLRLGRTPYACASSLDFSRRLVRLPLWAGLSESDVTRVIEAVKSFRPLAGTKG